MDSPCFWGLPPPDLGRRIHKQVACHWKDGSTTLADRAPDNSAQHNVQAVIRSVDGYPTANWFACVAPASTTYKSAEVTK
ncbi:hypothetical protein [Streptomyces sp. NPDC005548]|uniref:hypothetical protein n=1 Tax=Streptomyces sp. NPDC005548 TaxID=3364724 RepID=UPI00368B21CD